MLKELAANLILTVVFTALLGAYMYWHSSRLDAIADCMADRGDLHSEAIYNECVEETR